MEKGKFKENYQLFKKAWKDPKYKAIMKLSLYLIFIFGKLYQIYLTSSICLCLLFFRFSLSFLCFFYMEFTFLIFFEFWCRGASLFVERFYQK